jgi:hypothetical protein
VQPAWIPLCIQAAFFNASVAAAEPEARFPIHLSRREGGNSLETLVSGAVHFLSSMGLLLFSSALAGGLYNHFLHRQAFRSIAAGCAFGLCSMLFYFLPFAYDGVNLFDFRFVLWS